MTRRIAVLGAGIMGVSLAIQLARRGASVTLFDAASSPLTGASRWNEGKIHLGYLYAADPTLATARRVIDGGLQFAPLLRELVGEPLSDVTEADDLYLVHRNSVVPGDAAEDYYLRVSDLVRSHPRARDYLIDASSARVRRLTSSELSAVADPAEIVAGFACPERSVSTGRVADQLISALDNEALVSQRMNARVVAVEPADLANGSWRVKTQAGRSEAFDLVVNALWHGRIAIDSSAGLDPAPGWSHRYRVSAFVRANEPLCLPSAVVSTGPFGDVKNYNDRTFYVSWYPAGLLAHSDAIEPPEVALDDELKRKVAQGIAAGLSPTLPWVREIFAAASNVSIKGGFVFALGKGSLADARASLHRRDRFGIARLGNYISVDTGKYSSAPALALEIADLLAS